MKKCIGFLICFILMASNVYALDLSRVKVWSVTEVLTSSDLNAEFNNILNHSLTNNDIDAAAGIVGSKLDLSAPGTIGNTTASTGAFTTLTASSTFEATGTMTALDKIIFTQSDGNEFIDSLGDGFLDLEATTGLRFRINGTEQINLVDGIFQPTTDDDVDLGSTTKEFKDLWIDGTANIDSLVADTADINGGTLDGVQIGGTTATGELLVNNASDAADGLGDQGTSGQILKSAGAGSNPTWVSVIITSYFEPDGTNVLSYDNAESLLDLSVHHNILTPTSLTQAQLVAGKVGNMVYDFDGTNDFVTVTTNTLWNVMNKFTVEAWFFKDTTGTMVFIGESGDDFSWSIGDTNVIFNLDLTGGTEQMLGAHGLASSGTGAWVYAVMTYDGSTLTGYINGASIPGADASSGGTQNIGDLIIGGVGGTWDGKLDGIRILRGQVYSAAQILIRYNFYK